MKPDEKQIRLSRIRERMKEQALAREKMNIATDQVGEIEEVDDEGEEFTLRCHARGIIHRYVAYEIERVGNEWEAAISILRKEFESERFGFQDELENSMVGLKSILEKIRD